MSDILSGISDGPIDLTELVSGDNRVLSSPPTNANKAAFTAALDSSGDLQKTFEAVSSEYFGSDTSPTADGIIQTQVLNDGVKNKEALISSLEEADGDPQSLIDSFSQFETVESDLSTMVAVQSASEDSNGETAIAETERFQNAVDYEAIRSYQNWQQSAWNKAESRLDDGVVSNLSSLGALMLPFVEQSQIAELQLALDEGNVVEAFTLMGSAKQQIAENLVNGFSIGGEREAMADKMIDVVLQHKGVLFSDENILQTKDLLSHIIYPENPRDGMIALDNFFSLLDLTVIGAPLAKFVKTPIMAARLARLKKQGKAIPKSTDEAVDFEGEISKATEEANPELKAIDEDFGVEVTTEVDELASTAGGSVVIKDPTTPLKIKSGIDFGADVAEKVERSVGMKKVVSNTQPTTISQTYKHTNPHKARELSGAVGRTSTDELAQATYGSTRHDAIVYDNAPGIKTPDGRMDQKIDDPNRVQRLNNEVDVDMRTLTRSGAIEFNVAEKTAARARINNKFKEASGIVFRANRSTMKPVSDGMEIQAVYKPTDAGWSTPQEAKAMAQYALREIGVRDDQIKVMVKDGDAWRPYKEGDDLKSAYVQVNHTYKFNKNDVIDGVGPVWGNIVDRLLGSKSHLGRGGSIQRMLLDPQSMLPAFFTRSATVAVDKSFAVEARLQKEAEKLSKAYRKMSKERQEKINSFVVEANEKGLPYDSTNYAKNNMTQDDIDWLKGFRELQDNLYWVTNRQVATKLRNQGYNIFVNRGQDTALIAKPVPRNRISQENVSSSGTKLSKVSVYDSDLDEFVTLSPKDIDELYKSEGSLGKLRTPLSDGEDSVMFVKSNNTADTSFMREISDNDTVLNYRPGYYHVAYKNPIFIRKIHRNKDGEVLYQQALATAPDIQSAKDMMERLRKNEDGNPDDWSITPDLKQSVEEDDFFDLAVAQGRSPERARGQRLQDSEAPGYIGHEHIADPLESMENSIRNIAQRINFEQWLGVAKERFMKQYGDIVEGTRARSGAPARFDDLNLKDIKSDDVRKGKHAADALTTYEYIKYMENGYSNAFDDSFKLMLNKFANLVGNKGYSVLERGVRKVGELNPAQLAKRAAFQTLLALNPFRQAIVQSHQAIRLNFIAPTYTTNPAGLTNDLAMLAMAHNGMKIPKPMLKMAGMTQQDVVKMLEDFKASGLGLAVDANNLVRGGQKSMASEYWAVRGFDQTVGSVGRLSQRIGFDLGEQVNLATAWLTYRNKAKKAGQKLDRETMDNVAAQARNFTYNMSFAGDMPYNQNILSVLTQFLQVPHKALTQVAFNRDLLKGERFKLAALDLSMWGVPFTVGTGILAGIGIEDENARNIIQRGLESWAINSMFDMNTDFSSLAPYELSGEFRILEAFWAEGLAGVITESPASTVWAGGNSRLSEAMRITSQIVSHRTGFSTEGEYLEWKDAALSWAQLASGFSNAYKAFYMQEADKIISSRGDVLHGDMNFREKLAQALGFSPAELRDYYSTSKKAYEASQGWEDDAEQWYKTMSGVLARRGLTIQDMDFHSKVFGEFSRVFGNDNPRFLNWIKNRLRKDNNDGQNNLALNIMHDLWGIVTPNEQRDMLRNSGAPQEVIDAGLRVIDLQEEFEQKRKKDNNG